MPNELDHPADDCRPPTYEIRITGRLDPRWEEWFDGLTITVDNGDTLITGRVVDQAALHGVLRRVRDLGMPLISVTRIDSGPTRASSIDQETESSQRSPLGGQGLPDPPQR